ncbi:HNH endonuclease [Pseudomonas sp. 58 R 12]|uniref:HNH endonuclease n=1 Tax=Pseudomonas sp. 58 R 12 TaxID=1844107 RepID=UPI0008121FBD|nr:HNH endonuclease [Pseudomonas sp. 58 R 12]CRM12936.1 hypothetical protein [Pseudomonas sp. 58 R 12]
MNKLFVFTAGMTIARAHISDSISSPVSFIKLDAALPPDEAAYVKSLLPEGDGFFAWGAVPGEKNIPTWEEMSEGDIVLTAYDNHYQYVSSVLFKLHNRALAESIWGLDSEGKTWEYMYILSEPKPVHMHVASEPVINYLHNGYRGFTQIKSDRLDRIDDDYGDLNSFVATVFGVSIPRPIVPIEILVAEQDAESEGTFDPDSVIDERKKVFAAIVRRRGQPKFRTELLEAYEGRCAVTGCAVEAVLEAAHIKSYAGEKTNHVTNGILLRADIHTLYDLGKLKIDEKGVIHLSGDLKDSTYEVHDGKKISLPRGSKKAPNTKALKQKFSAGAPVLVTHTVTA